MFRAPFRRFAYRAVVVSAIAAAATILPGSSVATRRAWMTYAGTAQHDAQAPVRSQHIYGILWSTPVDLQPQYSGTILYIHYGSPLVTLANTVIVTVKTGQYDGFRVEGRRATNGGLLWAQATDYSLPYHGWVPPCGPTLTPSNTVVVPAAGGTVLVISNPDSTSPTVTRAAFFGIGAYDANPGAFDSAVRISTPITCDRLGNLYFGFVVTDVNPANLTSGLARISAGGVGSWTTASAAANDPAIRKVVYNCTPALSRDNSTVYVAVNENDWPGFGAGYLVGVNSQTLAPISRVRVKDVLYPDNDAILPDDGTAAPTVGPDGDVYLGVLENPFGYNHLRGWMLHFNSALTQTLIPGAFGWDDAASIVPPNAVPSYHGSSPYLLLTKYNNYAEGGGDGVNKIAVLDPRASMIDPISGASVMQEILTIAGPTPDPGNRSPDRPDAVREWCINTAAVDYLGKCALVNNEDGVLYRWDFTTNTLSESVVLTPGIGEAYTPTIVGPDGTVYAINNATLFAVGNVN